MVTVTSEGQSSSGGNSGSDPSGGSSAAAGGASSSYAAAPVQSSATGGQQPKPHETFNADPGTEAQTASSVAASSLAVLPATPTGSDAASPDDGSSSGSCTDGEM